MNAAPYSVDHVSLICAAYQRLLGQPLVPAEHAATPESAAAWLYESAPFCVLAHNAEADPRFTFANLAVQRCFGYDWDEMVGMPSRLSAEAPNREERDAFLQRVARDGFATGYRGLCIAKNGARFWIEDVSLWNLHDANGVYCGQAATYLRIVPV